MTDRRDGGAGDFWSRRRAAVAAEAEADARLDAETAVAAQRADVEAEAADKSDDALLAELGLPEPETLGEGADFKAFLTEAVPERLRRRALRALWRSNPVLANVDMLVDYGEDFTDAAKVVEVLNTTYQVGKGMLRHVEVIAEQAAAEAETPDMERAAEPVEASLEADPDPEQEVVLHPQPDEKSQDTDRVSYDHGRSGPEGEPQGMVVKRRMRFSFPTPAECQKGDA